MRRIGLFPHAGLPHVLPFFRLARALRGLGHEVWALGSDVVTVGHAHSWIYTKAKAFGLHERQAVHSSPDMTICEWLRQEIRDKQLDTLMLDAVWQGLAYEFCDEQGIVVLVHHAGLPDFRSGDMPTWCFVHPRHARSAWRDAREANERLERSGRGIRGMMSNVRRLTGRGEPGPGEFAFGCGEFARLPARRTVSLCPDIEFPDERGRTEYLGSLLPDPDAVARGSLPAEIAGSSQSLIACVFGTTGLNTPDEHRWLATSCRALAGRFPDSQVIAVMPRHYRDEINASSPPSNLRLYAWIPLWELLHSRQANKLLVTTPGVGAFREALLSATPVLAIPRRLDQMGAAARVEYFGLGNALVSEDLPSPAMLVGNVDSLLRDAGVQSRCRQLRDKARAFDATNPLKQFFDAL